MEEIKVRAWDEQNKEMHYPKDATENFGHGAIDSAHLLKHYSIIMLSTGLKDKNGKYIYRGDIVAVPYVTPLGTLTDEENYRAEVIFKNGSFCFHTYQGPLTEELSVWCKRGKTEYYSNIGEVTELLEETYLEVIGNKYEGVK